MAFIWTSQATANTSAIAKDASLARLTMLECAVAKGHSLSVCLSVCPSDRQTVTLVIHA